MSTRAIVTLFQQSQRVLDKVNPQIKEEAEKKIAEIKQKIPTKNSVKQMMMDEITSRGPELVCSIEMRNRIEFIYNRLQSKMTNLQFTLDNSNEKLLKIQEQLLKLQEIMTKITGIFAILNALIPVLQTIVITAKVGLILLKGPAADVDAGIKLANQIQKSNAKIKEIKDSIKIFTIKLAKVTAIITAASIVLSLALTTINTINNTLRSVIKLIESYYLKYTLMCDVEGDSMEDEDYQAAVNNAQSNLDNALGEGDEILIPENELLPNTIERIRNANFQVIQYRIA